MITAWPDVERALTDAIEGLFTKASDTGLSALVGQAVVGFAVPGSAPVSVSSEPEVLAGVATPANLEGLRFARIQVVGGQDDMITDTALVDIESFAPTREQARDDSELIRNWLLDSVGNRIGDMLVDSVRTAVRPRWRTYGNPKIQRFVASYWVSTRQAPVA